jgi:hypothetical protein
LTSRAFILNLPLARSPRQSAVIRVYDESGNVLQTNEHKGDFKEW